jgi:urease accessory protein
MTAAPKASLAQFENLVNGTRIMRRASDIRRAGQWDAARAADRVVLDAGDRHLRRVVLTGERGVRFLVDLPKPVQLRDGDAFALDDGALVQVTGHPEPLLEVAGQNALDTVRLAWHLGNRHTDVEIAGGKLRIRRDHVLEDMLRGLGAHLRALEAPFDPEPASPHGHHHGHEHGR